MGGGLGIARVSRDGGVLEMRSRHSIGGRRNRSVLGGRTASCRKGSGGAGWNRTNLGGFAVRHITNLSPRLLFCPGTCKIMPEDKGKCKPEGTRAGPGTIHSMQTYRPAPILPTVRGTSPSKDFACII